MDAENEPQNDRTPVNGAVTNDTLKATEEVKVQEIENDNTLLKETIKALTNDEAGDVGEQTIKAINVQESPGAIQEKWVAAMDSSVDGPASDGDEVETADMQLNIKVEEGKAPQKSSFLMIREWWEENNKDSAELTTLHHEIVQLCKVNKKRVTFLAVSSPPVILNPFYRRFSLPETDVDPVGAGGTPEGVPPITESHVSSLARSGPSPIRLERHRPLPALFGHRCDHNSSLSTFP